MDHDEARRRANELLGPANPYDLFPGLDDDIDRRVLASEHRIKYWVVCGILVNLVGVMAAAIPLIFYMGQVSRDAADAATTLDGVERRIEASEARINDRVLWESTAEQWMVSKGYLPPRSR